MPLQSIWMLRISLVYLFASGLFGSLILLHKATGLNPAVWSLLPVHYEMAVWGWMVQFVMGTAWWMFPKFMSGPPRGSGSAAWLIFGLYNSGLLLLLLSVYMRLPGLMSQAGRGLLVVSVVLFALLIRRRIKSFRREE